MTVNIELHMLPACIWLDVYYFILLFYFGNCMLHKPARKVPTSVQSQKMTVMKILDITTRENGPQSSRHSQLHPVKQHTFTDCCFATAVEQSARTASATRNLFITI